MNHLNSRQRSAVRYIDSPLLVLAGAGSGKTSVITHKIAYLIDQCHLPARTITAVTFTNKAAREMKSRIGSLLGRSAARGLTLCTFHQLGLSIIRAEHTKVGLKPNLTILDSEDSGTVLKELLQKDVFDPEGELGELQMTISRWKNLLVEPAEAASRARDDRELAWARTYERYNRYLATCNAVDFDDLIRLPVLLFTQHPEVLEKWQHRIRYLLVDEYQDTNHCQYEFVRQLVGGRNGLTVVGDDDQSIYAWRGARPENMASLQTDFPGLNVIKLEQNYRSTRRILNAANSLIGNNPHVFEKRIWSDLGLGEEIQVIKCEDDEAESERIAVEILDRHLRHNQGFRDFAVLYRGNHQSRQLEMKLQGYQIPYRVTGGTSFFGRNEIKDAMAYLRLLINPDDDAAFLRIINVPRREIGPNTLEKLSAYAGMREISMLAACREMGLAQHLGARSVKHLTTFANWLESTTRRCYDSDSLEAVRQLFSDIGYADWLQETCKTPYQAEKRLENVNLLIESLAKSMDDRESDAVASLQEAIGKLVLRDMLEQREQEDDADRVQLMTLHSAKGLEFDHVFLMGLEEDLLPHRNSIEDDNIEEERRLFYVGITRARNRLMLTLAGSRRMRGDMVETTPSRFLDELPQEDLTWEGRGNTSPEASEARGRETLSSLRQLMES